MSVPQPKDSKNNTSNNEINPEQALGLVSLGLMQKLSDKGIDNLNWLKEDEKCDTYELRQRLELTSLAIETGAPLSTCLLYTSPSPRDGLLSRMPSSA